MNHLAKLVNALFIIMFFVSCKAQNASEPDRVLSLKNHREEFLYRPNFHFTPRANWMNDPNGMFYLNGKYHLYFQYYPKDNVWGPMHWGHATTTDFVNWDEQPIALYPDELGYIFSGSAVVDHDNTSGFGKDGIVPIVAIYTNHSPSRKDAGFDDFQTQGIAYSLDEGQTWTTYNKNPVVANPGFFHFRDPKVTWDEVHNKWVMALACDQVVKFYGSKNLKDWDFLSDFGEDVGAHGGVWECPDLFRIKVRDTNEYKWVLLSSINPGGPNEGSATQYFVGEFDGTNFKLEESQKREMREHHDYWIDFGKDNYAGVTFANTANQDSKTLIGWMANWQYAIRVPTTIWRSAMTMPRHMYLVKNDQDYRMLSEPVDVETTTNKLEKATLLIEESTEIASSKDIVMDKAIFTINLKNGRSHGFHFDLKNDLDEVLHFGYDVKTNRFYIDRFKSGKIQFDKRFALKNSFAPRLNDDANILLKVILDKTSIELFFDDGKIVMTEIFFPNSPMNKLLVRPDKKGLQLEILNAEEITVAK